MEPVAIPSWYANQLNQRRREEDQAKALEIQNDARRTVNSQPLTWDFLLANQAGVWAEELAMENEDLESTQTRNQGMSGIVSRYPPSVDTSRILEWATLEWIDSRKLWRGGVFEAGNQYDAYTQVIWARSRRVGMATATSATGWRYVVARYWPPGNIVGEDPREKDERWSWAPLLTYWNSEYEYNEDSSGSESCSDADEENVDRDRTGRDRLSGNDQDLARG